MLALAAAATSLALSGCSTSVPRAPSLTATQFATHGSAEDIRQVRLAAQAALDAELQASSLDPTNSTKTRAAVLSTVRSNEDGSRRLSVLQTSFVQPVALSKYRSIKRALIENLGPDEKNWDRYKYQTTYGAARVEINSWPGTSVNNSVARVSALGVQKYYLWNGKVRTGYRTNYQLLLTRSRDAAHGWLVRVEKAGFPQGGP